MQLISAIWTPSFSPTCFFEIGVSIYIYLWNEWEGGLYEKIFASSDVERNKCNTFSTNDRKRLYFSRYLVIDTAIRAVVQLNGVELKVWAAPQARSTALTRKVKRNKPDNLEKKLEVRMIINSANTGSLGIKPRASVLAVPQRPDSIPKPRTQAIST